MLPKPNADFGASAVDELPKPPKAGFAGSVVFELRKPKAGLGASAVVELPNPPNAGLAASVVFELPKPSKAGLAGSAIVELPKPPKAGLAGSVVLELPKPNAALTVSVVAVELPKPPKVDLAGSDVEVPPPKPPKAGLEVSVLELPKPKTGLAASDAVVVAAAKPLKPNAALGASSCLPVMFVCWKANTLFSVDSLLLKGLDPERNEVLAELDAVPKNGALGLASSVFVAPKLNPLLGSSVLAPKPNPPAVLVFGSSGLAPKLNPPEAAPNEMGAAVGVAPKLMPASDGLDPNEEAPNEMPPGVDSPALAAFRPKLIDEEVLDKVPAAATRLENFVLVTSPPPVPGLAVEQQTHDVLSASLDTKHVEHSHLLPDFC